MTIHKYSVGQLCVIVRAIEYPHLIGRQCVVEKILHREDHPLGEIFNIFSPPSFDYEVDVPSEQSRYKCLECCLRPIKPGDLPDFAQEEESLVEEVPA